MTQPPPYGPPPPEPPNWQPPQAPPPQAPPPYAPPGYAPPPNWPPAQYQPAFGSPGLPPRKSRALPVVVAVVLAIVVLSVAVLVPVLLTRGDDDVAVARSDPDGSGVDTSNLSAVQEFEGLTNQHLALGESKDYPQSPSVGGDHAPVWLECGVYDEPVPEVNVVHDLEHGTTWLTYREDLVDEDGVDELAGVLPPNGILSPYPEQDAPVVITVWGRQLELTGPEDPRIKLFITKFAAGDTAPEPFASCHGGVDPDDILDSGGTAA